MSNETDVRLLIQLQIRKFLVLCNFTIKSWVSNVNEQQRESEIGILFNDNWLGGRLEKVRVYSRLAEYFIFFNFRWTLIPGWEIKEVNMVVILDTGHDGDFRNYF